jgi:hypothetical protein
MSHCVLGLTVDDLGPAAARSCSRQAASKPSALATRERTCKTIVTVWECAHPGLDALGATLGLQSGRMAL